MGRISKRKCAKRVCSTTVHKTDLHRNKIWFDNLHTLSSAPIQNFIAIFMPLKLVIFNFPIKARLFPSRGAGPVGLNAKFLPNSKWPPPIQFHTDLPTGFSMLYWIFQLGSIKRTRKWRSGEKHQRYMRGRHLPVHFPLYPSSPFPHLSWSVSNCVAKFSISRRRKATWCILALKTQAQSKKSHQ